MEPSVSVVTPAFNAERFLGQAIRSAAGQRFSDFEHLIVDDGSRDSTARIARRRASQDPRVRLLSLGRNCGLFQARNAGIRAARGRYIALLDADDVWLPGFLGRAVEVLENNKDVGVVFPWAKRFTRSPKGPYTAYRPRAGRYTFYDLFLHGCVPDSGGVLIRKECFREVGLYLSRFRVGADAEMWLRIARRSSHGSFFCVPSFLVLRRVHPGSLSFDYFKFKDREKVMDYVLETYLGELPRKRQIEVLRAALDRAMRNGARASGWLRAWMSGGRSADELLARLESQLRRGAEPREWLDAWALRARRAYGPGFFALAPHRNGAGGS